MAEHLHVPEAFERVGEDVPFGLFVGAAFLLVGQVGLEPTTALSTGSTVRGDTNYTVLAHILLELRFHMARGAELGSDTVSVRSAKPAVPPIPSGLRSILAGAAGFEPADGGVRDRCLTTWLHPNMMVIPAGIGPAFPA